MLSQYLVINKAESITSHMSHITKKFPTRSDTNLAVQPQKMVRDHTINVAKTKALISCAVTAQLICFYFSHMKKKRFSHDADHTLFK